MALPRNWKKRFLDTMRETANVRLACHAAGIPRSSAYFRREKNKKFAAEWDEAIEEATDMLEAVALARAVKGIERKRTVTTKEIKPDGSPQIISIQEISEQQYSNTLLMRLLEAHRPEKYRAHFEISANLSNAELLASIQARLTRLRQGPARDGAEGSDASSDDRG